MSRVVDELIERSVEEIGMSEPKRWNDASEVLYADRGVSILSPLNRITSTRLCAIAPQSPIDPRDKVRNGDQKRGTQLPLYRFGTSGTKICHGAHAFTATKSKQVLIRSDRANHMADCSGLHSSQSWRQHTVGPITRCSLRLFKP
jgi:hypothetical protein